MPSLPRQHGARRSTPRPPAKPIVRDKTAAYARQRAIIMRAEPLCRYCLATGKVTAATVLDHIVALALGGDNEPGNLAPACQPCNSAKAVHEARYLASGLPIADAALDLGLRGWIVRAQIQKSRQP